MNVFTRIAFYVVLITQFTYKVTIVILNLDFDLLTIINQTLPDIKARLLFFIVILIILMVIRQSKIKKLFTQVWDKKAPYP